MRRSNQLAKENIELLQEGNDLLKSVNDLLGGCFDDESCINCFEKNSPEMEVLDKDYSIQSET